MEQAVKSNEKGKRVTLHKNNWACCKVIAPWRSLQKPSKIPQTMLLLKCCAMMISAMYKLAHISDIPKLVKFIFSKRGAGDSNGTNVPAGERGSLWENRLETGCIPAPGKTEQLFVNSEQLETQKLKLQRQSVRRKKNVRFQKLLWSSFICSGFIRSQWHAVKRL